MRIWPLILILLSMAVPAAAAPLALTPGEWQISYKRTARFMFLSVDKAGTKSICSTGSIADLITASVNESGCVVTKQRQIPDGLTFQGYCNVKKIDAKVNVVVTAQLLGKGKAVFTVATPPGETLTYREQGLATYVSGTCTKS